jgi:hypothetical protein
LIADTGEDRSPAGALLVCERGAIHYLSIQFL